MAFRIAKPDAGLDLLADFTGDYQQDPDTDASSKIYWMQRILVGKINFDAGMVVRHGLAHGFQAIQLHQFSFYRLERLWFRRVHLVSVIDHENDSVARTREGVWDRF